MLVKQTLMVNFITETEDFIGFLTDFLTPISANFGSFFLF
ncbi:hypothetical protein BPO_2367 [Bergeyella porcorum]|uniref:Uncharacterized protein n=1 Tax=Bergeyella porcorum TaxID=1735111 RepID=A0AAU0F455_9FLAO